MGEPARDPAAYEVPKSKGSTHLGKASTSGVRLSEKEWSEKLRTNIYKDGGVLRNKATEPGHRIKFPQGFDDHKDSGVYLCSGCYFAGQQVPLYTSSMKFDCGCGWPGFWTNVKDEVYEQRDADGRRCEILCSKCDGHLGHGFGYCTDERHCVNSLSLVFLPAKGGEAVPWAELCEAGLLELLTRLLVPSFSEDDLVLECVLLASNLACCPESAQHIAGSRLPALMQDLLVEKREDEEIVVQLLFVFHCLLHHDEVREYVLQETELAPCIMRFARARNPLVLEYATALLQIVATTNDAPGAEDGTPAWVEQIKAFRFEQHNPEWCRCVTRELSGGTGMSPGGAYGGYYDDHEGSGAEDEEEFAFHWAGVDAADPRDLAKRDWANQDFAKLSHSSRWQT
eukprot:s1751_g13.t1